MVQFQRHPVALQPCAELNYEHRYDVIRPLSHDYQSRDKVFDFDVRSHNESRPLSRDYQG